MSGFRGSDDQLDEEIATLERIARLRMRRVTKEFAELDEDLKVLKRERARRRAMTEVPVQTTDGVLETAG
jgi:hypothetical protein